MSKQLISAVLAWGIMAVAAAAAFARPAIVPTPKQYLDIPIEPVTMAAPVTILLGDKASPVEECAAETLQASVKRLFGQEWSVAREGKAPSSGTTILLGQRSTHRRIEQLCVERHLKIDEESPGREGYLLQPVKSDTGPTVLIAGTDARGALYGQDTFLQLLSSAEGRVTMYPAAVRDAPTVPWRGRPQTQVAHHLQPGIMDCYVTSRINFIDLRNGTYAFEPDYQLTDKDKADITTVIREARRRGIVVFATINCAVPRSKYDMVMARFEEFIALGADAVWPSFDDKGPGEAPEEIVKRVLELAARNKISGQQIATTPPKGSYQTIKVPFNEKVMKVPGMEQALWFWTCLPSAEADKEAKAIGLKCLPSWWHNWPRPESGLAHIEGSSLAGEPYMELPSMAVGWHEPPDAWLATGGAYCQAVMPWGGNGWEQYYITPVIGWWGWNPAAYDFSAVRSRLYAMIFGASQVAALTDFDDTLARAKALFVCPTRHPSKWKPTSPARLVKVEDRPKAVDLLVRMETFLSLIEKDAGHNTVLSKTRLERLLKAMRSELQAGKVGAQIEFPEYWWDGHQRRLLTAVYAGDGPAADQLATDARARLQANLERIRGGLSFLSITPAYLKYWEGRAGLDAAGWGKIVEQRKAELAQRVKDYGWFEVVLSKLLKDAKNIPYGRGRGAAERPWRIIASAVPGGQEQFQGEWMAGPIHQDGNDVAAFALDRDAESQPGEYAELPVSLPISGSRDRLGLLIFMNCHTKDLLGGERVPGRWSEHAAVQLLWEDRVLWQGDLGLPREGNAWDVVRLPTIPESVTNLPLRLRAISLRSSGGMRSFSFVGPIRLLELSR